METLVNLQALAEQLLPGDADEQAARVFGVILRELATGSPVSPGKLAKAMGWPASKVSAALEQVPGVEYDGSGNVVGYGLTLRKTPHAFEVDGRRLYTWCALDALMFPALIGKTAQIFTACAATGVPVHLTVTPDEVQSLEPAGAMVSLVTPEDSRDIRSTFCCHVHFFASASAAEAWAVTRKQVTLVSVAEAFRLGQELSRRSLLR